MVISGNGGGLSGMSCRLSEQAGVKGSDFSLLPCADDVLLFRHELGWMAVASCEGDGDLLACAN